MSVKTWLLSMVRDDRAHEALDEREAVVDETIEGLRAEREKNGFGRLFDVATKPPAYPQPLHLRKE